MRNPLQVRLDELVSAFGSGAAADEVFTLDADVMWTERPAPRPPVAIGDLESELAALAGDLAAASALVDVLSHKEQLMSVEGKANAERWAASFGELAAHVRTNPKAKANLRLVTRARFVSDIQADLALAASRAETVTNESLQAWLVGDQFEPDVARLPALGRVRELMHRRLANADDRWESNDLYDMLFLSTAAGYADFVVGERKTCNYLRQMGSVTTPGAQVFTRMADAVVALEELVGSFPASPIV